MLQYEGGRHLLVINMKASLAKASVIEVVNFCAREMATVADKGTGEMGFDVSLLARHCQQVRATT